MHSVFDESGHYLGDYIPYGNIGGDLWELFHPGTVQAEQAAVGQTPSSTAEIVSGAASDIGTQAAADITSGVQQLGKWIVLGALVYVGYQAWKG